MAKTIESSAPGKVILHGEHAVVFGKHAVAVSVDLRTTVTVQSDPNAQVVVLKLRGFDCELTWTLNELEKFKLGECQSNGSLEYNTSVGTELESLFKDKSPKEANDSVRAFLFLYFGLSDIYCNSKRLPLTVTVSSVLPIGAGLGSSAAFSVSLCGALIRSFGLEESLPFISRTAYEIERIFHGRPSGIDNSICTFGGALLFKNGVIEEQVTNAEIVPIILVYTNVKRNTKNLVKITSERREKYADVVNNIMNAIDAITLKAWNYIRTKRVSTETDTLVEMNQHLLNSIGAGHPCIDTIVTSAKKYGFNAKLTGAGGGGTVVVYLSKGYKQNDVELLKKELTANGFQFWQVSTGGNGLLIK